MRYTLLIALTAVGCTSTGVKTTPPVSAPSASSAVQSSSPPTSTGDATVLCVKGLGCPLCAANVKKSLEAVPGVSSAAVNLGTGRVTVHANSSVTDEQMKGAVSQAGFTLEKVEHPGATK